LYCERLLAGVLVEVHQDRGRRARSDRDRLLALGILRVLEDDFTNAEADLDNGERAFLSETADGWRISAAGCKAGDGPPEDVPMDCALEA